MKLLSNPLRIQKSAFKNQKPRTPYFNARVDHRKTIKKSKIIACQMCSCYWYSQKNVLSKDRDSH